MGTISRLVSRFTSGGGGRRGASPRGGATRGTPGGAGNSQDAKIGKAVRTAVNKATGKRR